MFYVKPTLIYIIFQLISMKSDKQEELSVMVLENIKYQWNKNTSRGNYYVINACEVADIASW